MMWLILFIIGAFERAPRIHNVYNQKSELLGEASDPCDENWAPPRYDHILNRLQMTTNIIKIGDVHYLIFMFVQYYIIYNYVENKK